MPGSVSASEVTSVLASLDDTCESNLREQPARATCEAGGRVREGSPVALVPNYYYY